MVAMRNCLILLLVCLSAAVSVVNSYTGSVINSYKDRFVRQQMISIGSGVTLVENKCGRRSVVRCAVACSNADYVCQGFVFNSTTCENGTPISEPGDCRLLWVTNLTAIQLSTTAEKCQQVFLLDFCWKHNPCLNGGTCSIYDWPSICHCQTGYIGTYCEKFQPRDCAEVLSAGFNRSGVYTVYIGGAKKPTDVFCDMSTACGGWTVLQRRIDGSVQFYRNWTEYAKGFGNVSREFWLDDGNTIENCSSELLT